jgi:hypothetical protein
MEVEVISTLIRAFDASEFSPPPSPYDYFNCHRLNFLALQGN